MENDPIASVVICTKDRSNTLSRLLDSLNKQTTVPNEVIIVDASISDDTKSMLEQKKTQLPFDIIYKKTFPGLARQRNIGYALSHGKYLFFFDDDVVLEPDYIGVICDTFERYWNKKIGGITGRIVNIEKSSSLLERIFKKVFMLSDLGEGKIKLSGFPSLKIGEQAGFVGFLSGCNMVYSQKASSQFFFDEALTGYSYMEDVDLSYRVGKKYLLYYQPEARLCHYPTTYKTNNTRTLRKMMIQHHRYLFKKNHDHDFKHLFCHWMSIVGAFFYYILLQRDFNAGLGIIDGLRDPKRI